MTQTNHMQDLKSMNLRGKKRATNMAKKYTLNNTRRACFLTCISVLSSKYRKFKNNPLDLLYWKPLVLSGTIFPYEIWLKRPSWERETNQIVSEIYAYVATANSSNDPGHQVQSLTVNKISRDFRNALQLEWGYKRLLIEKENS